MEAGVKFGKGNVTPQRERPYWEPPRSALGKIDAHIEEIGADEPHERPKLTLRQQFAQELWKRRAFALVAAFILVAMVAVAVDGSFEGRQPKSSPSSSALAALPTDFQQSGYFPGDSGYGIYPVSTVPETQSPTSSTMYTVTYDPNYGGGNPDSTDSPVPVAANGWPIKVVNDQDVDPTTAMVGPDGSVYIDGMPALNSTGHARAGWLVLPNGDRASVVGFGTDGTIYATEDTDTADGDSTDTKLYAFGSNGKVKSGWPLDFGNEPDFEIGPAGTVYAFSYTDSGTTVTVLDSAGKSKAHWTFGAGFNSSCGDAILPDGTLFYSYTASTGSDCSIAVFGPTGKRLSANSPARGWDELTMSAAGTVVAVGYDYEPYSTTVVAQTRIAVIGTDGNPAAGWPIALEGAASMPSFGADGTIYVARLGLGTQPAQLTAYDQSGTLKPGWPVQLPAGFAAFTGDDGGLPLPPVVGDDAVYVAATDGNWTGSVIAFDAAGAILPGWPYTLPQAFGDVSSQSVMASSSNPGPLFVARPGGKGTLFLMLDGEIVALGSDGKVVSGWPYVMPDPDNGSWDAWTATPDGGLIAISEAQDTDGVTTVTIVRLTPSGTVVH
jgi:hypothetical protein